MNVTQFIKCFKYILIQEGIPPSSWFARWSLFVYPFWRDNEKKQVGFKVMAYRGVNSKNERIMKAVLKHGLNCFVSGVASGASGLGGIAGGLNDVSGKYGGLPQAFGVDVGAIQLATVLEDPSSSPRDIANGILASGKLLMYAIVRVDKVPGGHKMRLRICRDYKGRPNMRDADWAKARIDKFQDLGGIFEYTAWVNGIVFKGGRPVGNYLR